MLTRDVCMQLGPPVLSYRISKHVLLILIDFRLDTIFFIYARLTRSHGELSKMRHVCDFFVKNSQKRSTYFFNVAPVAAFN
jgi:hypothetical protein